MFRSVLAVLFINFKRIYSDSIQSESWNDVDYPIEMTVIKMMNLHHNLLFKGTKEFLLQLLVKRNNFNIRSQL